MFYVYFRGVVGTPKAVHILNAGTCECHLTLLKEFCGYDLVILR